MVTKNSVIKRLGAALAVLLAFAMVMSTVSMRANAILLDKKGIYYTDFATRDDALAAADALNTKILAEGSVLLKNDGTLPVNGNEKISVFGGMQRNPVGASGTGLLQSLREGGFTVNPILETFYSSNGSIGTERINFTPQQEQSLEMYNDLAIIFLARTGSEGNDPARITNEIEDNTDGDGVPYNWTHEALGHKGSFIAEGASNAPEGHKGGFVISDPDNFYKHYLEITDSEEALISYVKKHFSKIVVILNTSNAMEMANLQEDDAINAILWIGRPGSTGLAALAGLLNGTYNPSGKLVDEWNRDFTADPTWQNFGTNDQVGGGYDYFYDATLPGAPTQQYSLGTISGDGFKGIDYDEDIYVGYKYFETVYAEIKAGHLGYDADTHKIVKSGGATGDAAAEAWWQYAVVYPFGYGLSYTDFEMTFDSLYY
ncbi:MAG: glycoside hydrolase family 3 C-terminal domain-containing protein, partial [Lachnospiraceae bacterium]|nr:glycoside hydrolase family 3 C-terminal domain-containing protein [Lachnospiraceae bacterium]